MDFLANPIPQFWREAFFQSNQSLFLILGGVHARSSSPPVSYIFQDSVSLIQSNPFPRLGTYQEHVVIFPLPLLPSPKAQNLYLSLFLS